MATGSRSRWRLVSPLLAALLAATPSLGRCGDSAPAPGGHAEVIAKVLPSVVDVRSTRKGPGAGRALGSGVIVSADGIILTNNHVIKGAAEIVVVLATDRREYPAKVVGTDPKTDLAVLRIDARNLPALALADSDRVRVGDAVFAIGNPLGVGQTVTAGIVSARGRALGMADYEDFLQTDAAINPGNSGGALVDTDGRLVGINTAIVSKSGGSQGLGFAIPANLARNVMKQLLANGQVRRSVLGVDGVDLTPENQRQLALASTAGTLVDHVEQGSAAAAAGVKAGDVIAEYDGRPVRDSRNLRMLVANTPPGTNIKLTVIRQGQRAALTVKLEPATGEQPAADRLGMTVDEISAQDRQQRGIPASVKGLLVTEVERDSRAFRAGLQAGDVIRTVNGTSGTTLADVPAVLAAAKEPVRLQLWRNGEELAVEIRR